MKLKAAGQQAVITHPEHPEIRITVEKPPVKDSIAWGDILDAHTEKNKVAMNPLTEKPIFRNGQLVVLPAKPNVPFDVTLDTMAKYVKGIEGFEDFTFSGSLAEAKDVLREFLDSRFSWKAVEDVPVLNDEGEPEKDKHGKPKTQKKEVTHNFFNHVITKLFDQETYGDPLGSGSASTATGDSA